MKLPERARVKDRLKPRWMSKLSVDLCYSKGDFWRGACVARNKSQAHWVEICILRSPGRFMCTLKSGMHWAPQFTTFQKLTPHIFNLDCMAALFTVAKSGSTPSIYGDEWMSQSNVVRIYSRTSYKKPATWINLEDTILSEISQSHTHTKKTCMTPLTWDS